MTTHDCEEIRVERNLLIPLADGVTLAADLYMPAGEGPFPTLVSLYPYHKDDLIGCMLEYPRRYFAEHGYASLLVDLRGLGNSEGVAWEMLDANEGEDGAAVIDWAAEQNWCDGNIGMWGFSYGGVTTLQTASRRPAALKAIAPIETLSDIYRELVTRLDCLPFFGNWGAVMVSMNIMPPCYQDPEGRWYKVWMDRLKKGFPHIFAAKEHPHYDEYWQSRVIPVENIDVPTLMIGGWRDVNVHAMFNIYESIAAPKKLFQGPWGHLLPYHSPVEPWDYLHELKRWWDRWLKSEDNGIDAEPTVTMFTQGSGQWRTEPAWPIERSEHRSLYLGEDGMLAEQLPADSATIPYEADPTVGTTAGLWEGTGLGIGLPVDQGPDDLCSMTFTTNPLSDDLEITGSPQALLKVSLQSGNDMNLVAKLCAVAPDGSSSLITVGNIKGSTYVSDEHPQALETDKVYEFKVPLFTTSYLVPRGHQLRLSVSCSDFPRLWPTKTNPTIQLHVGADNSSMLQLPIVPPTTDALPAPVIRRPDPAVSDAPLAIDFAPTWKVEDDFIDGSKTVSMGSTQLTDLPAGGRMKMQVNVAASVPRNRPEAARVEGMSTFHLDLPSVGEVVVHSQTHLSSTTMYLEGKVTMNGKEIFDKKWLR